jgi:cytoskeletal protein RodZ
MQSFGEFLRQKRREKSVRLEDIAHVTRVSEKALRHLEADEVDQLPPEVFVRGFVRAYAEFIGVDAGEVLRRYNSSRGHKAPVDVGPLDGQRSDVDEPIAESTPRPKAEHTRTFFPPSLGAKGESKRGPVTLVVIILVIVATLAMSYLLRTPSSSGDGITERDHTTGEARQA